MDGQRVETLTAGAERLKAFTDAVVAIALTLLILPLMESVGESAREHGTAGEWIAGHGDQLFSFVLSFVLIASFWLGHHRLFEHVHRTTRALLSLTVAWMFTIVWLPVATAIVGQMPNDIVQKGLYIGALFATSVMALVIGIYIRRHPELHDIPEPRLRSGLIADGIAAGLFLAAFALAALIPAVGYWAMFLLVLTGPLHALIWKRVSRHQSST